MAEPLPARSDITLYRGDTRVWTDTLERNTGTATEPVWQPINLTGHTAIAQIRDGRTPTSAVVATMTTTIPDAMGGKVRRELTATASAAIPDPTEGVSYWWDLQITRTVDGFVRTYLYGRVKVDGDVSR